MTQTTTLFPNQIDSWADPSADDHLDTPGVEHDLLHDGALDAIRAIETKLGIASSPDTGSIDYKMAHHTHLGTDGSQKFAQVSMNNTLSTGKAIVSKVGSETFNRMEMTADGGLGWGPGSAAIDVLLGRASVNRLSLTGSLGVFNNNTANPGLSVNRVAGQSSGYIIASRDESSVILGGTQYEGTIATSRRLLAGSLSAITNTPVVSIDNTLSTGTPLLGMRAAAGQAIDLIQVLSSSNSKIWAVASDGVLNLSNVAGESFATGLGIGDKIALYATTYGLGVQAGTLVLYTGQDVGIRAYSSTGASSSGTNAITLASSGTIRALAQNHYFGNNADSSSVGTRNRIFAGVTAIGMIAEGDATTLDVDTLVRTKGDGIGRLQNGASQDVFDWGNDGAGNRALAFFSSSLSPKLVITGSRAGNAALASLLTALATYGLFTNSTTA